MSASVRRIGIALLCAAVATAWAPSASAFFPRGGFDLYGQMRLAVWPLVDFDTNNDGDVTAGEGIGFWVEGGEDGFTDAEVEKIRAAFAVWESVPTSYVAFQITAFPQDPITTTEEAPDFMPMISIQGVDEEDAETEASKQDDADTGTVAELSDALLGTTLVVFAIEDTIIEAGGNAYWLGAGTMVDADIVLNAAAHRIADGEVSAVADITATTVRALGSVLGLGETPLNNLRMTDTVGEEESLSYLVENEVFYYTGGDGEQGFIGATPTMFPFSFEVEDASGKRSQGWTDLAPDDISGISWMYPRGSQSGFFEIDHYARTNTRAGTGLPSVAISGAHIVAWADTDDDDQTPRIPLFSTMTGLYEPYVNTELVGKFSLKGLWKQAEVPGQSGIKFNPSYVLTLNPLNSTGLERQAPEGFSPDLFDTLQGDWPISYSLSPRDTEFSTNYPSEVFHEVENLIDISEREAGSGLIWNFDRNKVISQDTERTISTILPNNEPMFGDPNDVCPMNIIDGGSEVTTTASIASKGLRQFRNKFLLSSALGTALVDAYYKVSPMMARFLLQHDQALVLFKKGMALMYWMIDYAHYVGFACLALFSSLWLWRRRQAKGVVTLLLVVILLGAGGVAHAGMRYMPLAEFVENVDAVVTGTVTATESYWKKGGHIYTDVVVDIDDTAKGAINKSSNLVFSVIGGRVDGIVMYASEIPTFKAGEEVLLYLREVEGRGYVVYGGLRGKVSVGTDEESGEKFVYAGAEATAKMLAADTQGLQKADNLSEKVSLEAYLGLVRSLAQAEDEEAK